MIYLGLARPIILKGVKHNVTTGGIPAVELKWTATYRIEVEILTGFSRSLRYDRGSIQRKPVKKNIARSRGLYLNRIIIDDVYLVNYEIIVVNAGACDAAFEGVLNVFRRHLVSILELHALTQMEYSGKLVNDILAMARQETFDTFDVLGIVGRGNRADACARPAPDMVVKAGTPVLRANHIDDVFFALMRFDDAAAAAPFRTGCRANRNNLA